MLTILECICLCKFKQRAIALKIYHIEDLNAIHHLNLTHFEVV